MPIIVVFLLWAIPSFLFAVGWIYNLFHILGFLHVTIANWTGFMIFEVIGTVAAYGGILGWLEILHLIP